MIKCEILRKFQGRGIKIARVKFFRTDEPFIFFNILSAISLQVTPPCMIHRCLGSPSHTLLSLYISGVGGNRQSILAGVRLLVAIGISPLSYLGNTEVVDDQPLNQ